VVKKQILPLLASLEKFWKNPLVPPLKNPSDGHVHVGPLGLYIFDIYSLFEIQNVINLNMCHAPGD